MGVQMGTPEKPQRNWAWCDRQQTPAVRSGHSLRSLQLLQTQAELLGVGPVGMQGACAALT